MNDCHWPPLQWPAQDGQLEYASLYWQPIKKTFTYFKNYKPSLRLLTPGQCKVAYTQPGTQDTGITRQAETQGNRLRKRILREKWCLHKTRHTIFKKTRLRDLLECRVKKGMSTYRTVLFVVLSFTCGWFWSDRPACGLSTTIHPFRLFNVLGAQPARVSQLCTSVFACDGCPSISKSSGMIVHNTVVIIWDSAWVDGIWGHYGELRADSWTIEKRLVY